MRSVILSLALTSLAASAAAQPKPAAPPPPAGAAPQVKTSDDIKRESLEGAATAPLRDLNVLRTKIPPVLLQAMADPYARPPRNYRCPDLIALIRPLDEVLGSDLDRVSVEDEDFLQRGRETALGVAADFASDAIPFRGWVRKLSGAESHDRLVRDAIIAGGVRRGYLKGLGEARGCLPPATPSHERAGSPVPIDSPSERFKPRYPIRSSSAAPGSSSGNPPAGSGR